MGQLCWYARALTESFVVFRRDASAGFCVGWQMAVPTWKMLAGVPEFPYKCTDCEEEKFDGSVTFRLHCMYDGRTRVFYKSGFYNSKGYVTWLNGGCAVLEFAVHKLGDKVSPETSVAFRPVCNTCLNEDAVPVTVKVHKENEAAIAAEAARQLEKDVCKRKQRAQELAIARIYKRRRCSGYINYSSSSDSDDKAAKL